MTPQELQKPTEKIAGGGDAVYGIGVIGAWIYYLKRATTNKERAFGLAKGLVWPAFLVYALLVFLEEK